MFNKRFDPYELSPGCVFFSEPEYVDIGRADKTPASPYLEVESDYKLSEHFTYSELIYSDTAIKLGINNGVPANRPDIIERAKYVATEILEPLRDLYGPFRPNSWFRGEELEFAITGQDGFMNYVRKTVSTGELDPLLKQLKATQSLEILKSQSEVSDIADKLYFVWQQYFARKQHPNGEAVDLKISKAGSVPQLHKTLKGFNKPYDQLILEMHKPANPMSGWVHYSIINESLEVNKGRKNRKMDFTIS